MFMVSSFKGVRFMGRILIIVQCTYPTTTTPLSSPTNKTPPQSKKLITNLEKESEENQYKVQLVPTLRLTKDSAVVIQIISKNKQRITVLFSESKIKTNLKSLLNLFLFFKRFIILKDLQK